MDGSEARPALLGAIGSTPVVQLRRLAGSDSGEVWLKLESTNPTGSYKDRMALAMIEGAERSGRLQPGQPVVEYSGGSTGSSLAFVCAVKGYPLRIVTSDAFSPEKLETMEAFGAQLEILPSPEGITADLIPRMMERAAEIVGEVDGYPTDQFNNTDMIDGYDELGSELADQLDGRLEAFCAYVGTAGHFLGVTRALRRTIPDVHRAVIEPAESPVISEGRAGTHHIEGGGVGFWPPLLAEDDFDEVVAVPEAEAFATARRAAQLEGLLCGPSTGANIAVALRLAERLGPGSRIATTNVDSGLRYLARGLELELLG
jgi:cysteine synthase A